MARGKRELKELACAVDLIIEVRDARAPSLTSSPAIDLFKSNIKVCTVLSKADLAVESVTREWKNRLHSEGMPALALDLRKGGVGKLKRAMGKLKPSFRDLRAAVVGVPNVGKSMLINALAGKKAATVGGVPGVTRGVSWFKGNGFLLADSPGILDPHGDARAHRMISWLGSSRGEVIGSYEEHAKECIAFLVKNSLWRGVEDAWQIAPDRDPFVTLERIGRRLGKLVSGGEVDMEAAGRAFMDAFATGRLGRISLEKPGDPPLWESL